jgi:hypothetical protein
MKTAIIFTLSFGISTLFSANPNQLIMPSSGEEYHLEKVQLNQSNFDPGLPGIGKVWILDNLTGTSVSIKVDAAAENPFYSEFPTADIVIENDYIGTSTRSFGNLHYHFYNNSGGSMMKLGRVDLDTVTGEEHINKFSNSEQKMDNILFYNHEFSDTWEGSYTHPLKNKTVFWSDGNTACQIDSKGKMRVSGYTLEDVYRIRRERTYTERASFMTPQNYKTISYEWWVANVPVPIVYMEHIVSLDGSTPDQYFAYYLDKAHYLPLGEEEIANRVDEVKMYPNPVNDYVNFSFDLKDESMVKISLLDGSGRVVSELLEERKMAGRHNVSSYLNVSPGMYMVRFDFDGETVVKRLAVN